MSNIGRVAYTVVEMGDGMYELAMVVETVDGYYPQPMTATMQDELQAIADRLNAELGNTEQDVKDIVEASMFPQGVKAQAARERLGI